MAIASGRRAFLKGAGAAGLAAPLQADAGAPPLRPYDVPRTSVIPLKSAINGIAYELYVRVPGSYAAGSARYPTVWLLDADYSFAIAANHAEHLADRSHIPDQILVAVAYPGVAGNMTRYRMERSRDYTPVFAPDGGYGPEFQKASGGGPAFLRMIAEEAMPLVDRLFRTDPAQRTLTGHSYGGLFASWVLQQHPALFDRYLIVSPSLWYANGWLLEREAAKAWQPLPRPTRVWMGVGAWEQQASGRMVSDLVRFAGQLAARGTPGLKVEHKIFPDETHASIFPAAFSTGIRHLYPTDWLARADPAMLEGCPASS
jgi:predicted alpha/beta superfamily hydrolase